MFQKSQNDITRTLYKMIDESIENCRFNQDAAQKKMAEWIAQDRRFDAYDPSYVAREAFDSRRTGRQLQLDKPLQTHSLPPTYQGR